MFRSCEFQANQQNQPPFIQNDSTTNCVNFLFWQRTKCSSHQATDHSSLFSYNILRVRETRVNKYHSTQSLALHKTHRIIGPFLANLFRRSSQRNISFRLLRLLFFHRNYFIAARPLCAIIALQCASMRLFSWSGWLASCLCLCRR